MWGSLLFLVLYGITTVFGEACSTEGSVRLAAFKPSDHHAGFVEVCHNGEWGTVCADGFSIPWSEKNAQVVCRQLGYSGALNSVLQDTLPVTYRINESSGVPVHYKNVYCDGTETTLNECTLSENSGDCQHLLDAAIVCRKHARFGDVRLVGSTSNGEGIVEINDVALGWIRVCPDTWTDAEAGVVCRQLGYETGVSNIYSRRNIESLSKVALDFSCMHTNDVIEDCYSFSSSVFMCSASSSAHAGVICTSSSAPEGAVRLTGGSSGDNGRVEVLYNGKWGTVCNYRGWRVSDGMVVCHELGYNPNNEGISISPSERFSGSSSVKPIWLAGLVCNVGDSTISDCTNDPPIGYGERCDHTTHDARLDCDVDLNIELSEGAITGIVVGSIAFVCFMCCCVYCSYLFKDDCKKKYPSCYKIATCWNCCKSYRRKRRSSNATTRNRRPLNTTVGRQSLNPPNTTNSIAAATTTTRVTRKVRVVPSSSSSSSARPKPKPQPSSFQVTQEAPPPYSAPTGLVSEVLAALPRQDSQHGVSGLTIADTTDLPPPYASPSGTDNNLPETTTVSGEGNSTPNEPPQN